MLNFYEKFITKFYSVFKITKGNTEKQTGLFGIKNLLPNLFNFENDRDHHRQKRWLNFNEKFIKEFFWIPKMTKCNTDKKSGLTLFKDLLPHSL